MLLTSSPSFPSFLASLDLAISNKPKNFGLCEEELVCKCGKQFRVLGNSSGDEAI